MDKENLIEYIKWLISELDGRYGSEYDQTTTRKDMQTYIAKNEVRKMLLSIIGELYCSN